MKTNLITKFAFALSMLFALSFAKAQNPACPTDFNKDGITNNADYLIFASKYGQTCPSGTPCSTDLNGDGVTNVNDYLIFGAQYGKRCHVMIFSVSSATYSGGYVNIPVSISSDNTIMGFDFEMKFNESRLTFDQVISVNNPPANSSLYHFNTNDRFLRFTSTINPGNYLNDVPVAWIRFATSQTNINVADFNNLLSVLGSNQSGYILK